MVVVTALPACRSEHATRSVSESSRATVTPSASTSAGAPAGAPGPSRVDPKDGISAGALGDDKRMENAVASMRACTVDKDCVLVRVSCGAEAAVAATSKVDAEKAMLAVCPPQGSGGWNPDVAPPKVTCAARRCEIAR